MKTSTIDARVEFHVVLRAIPETAAYSVTIGEIQDGRFVLTDRRPDSYPCDWQEVKDNPLAPGQSYVAAHDLRSVALDLLIHCDDVSFYPNMLVFKVKDFPVTYEKSTEENEE
nr:MAG TPA: hypothetical protein [Microviridae sp.]